MPRWSCGLIGQITGADDSILAPVRIDECAACCQASRPTQDSPNFITASVLLKALEEIVAKNGVEGCSRQRAEDLMPLAKENLLTIGPGAFSRDLPPAPVRRGPCRMLGGQTGERLCEECAGHVRVKVFACGHPAHQKTTLRECQSCRDYEPHLMRGGGVQRWAVGVTTAPRRGNTLRRTLRSLRHAGWTTETVYIFAEAKSARWWHTAGLGPLRLVRRTKPRAGAWPSFLLGLTELYLRHPDVDAFFMLQDDVEFVAGLKDYLAENLWPASECGCVSLHTPRHLQPQSGAGFYKAELGWSVWGAQGFIFPNATVRSLLSDRTIIEHRMRGIGNGLKNVDSVVGDWCKRTGYPFWLHSPSLAEHTGRHSTIWKVSSLEGRRSSADFPGIARDIRTIMPALLAERGGEPPPPIMMLNDGSVVQAEDATPDDVQPHEETPRSWENTSLDIVSISIGLPWVWDDWSEWLLHSEMPSSVSLFLVDNIAESDQEGRRRMAAFAARCLDSGRFETVSVTKGPGPAGARGSAERDRSIADIFSQVVSMTRAEWLFLLDDDVIPPPGALRRLCADWQDKASTGHRPGLISGAYPSATNTALLAAGIGEHRWERSIAAAGNENQLLRVDFAGNGCLLADGVAVRCHLPLESGNAEGWRMGPDAWLSRRLRQSGYTVWLDTGVCCEHRFRPPA